MLYHLAGFAPVVLAIAVLPGWGCSRGPAPVLPPEIDAAAAGKLAVERYDTDRDGLIRGTELTRAPALKAAIENLDTDKDGALSSEEITARVKAWQATEVGATSLSCTVTYRGRPLPEASVIFVPEEFLGDEIQPATGQTDQFGVAVLTLPRDPDVPGDSPGVQYGLYRVEITHEDTDIPAMYNTRTILGQEVADDCPEVRRGIEFQLK